MTANVPLVFFYHRLNCYSFNALAGAIDSDPALADTDISLATTGDAVLARASDAVKRHGKAIVALSLMTSQMEEMRQLIGKLRTGCGSKAVILAGGPHATACPEEVREAGADVVFRGEAELSFPAVLRDISDGREIQGVQSSADTVCLDSFLSISPKRGMFGPIEITRGCAFACSYCQTSRIFGVKLRHRGIDSIVRQAAVLRSGNRKVVRLLSPNAFSYGSPDGRQLNLQAIRDLLAALRKAVTGKARILFAHFPSEARPEHIIPETLDLLKEFADNDEIVIGAQSGSRRMLEACHRAHSVEQVLAAVSLARKYGYKVIIDFIYGLPGENEADMLESVKVMEEVVRMGARIHPHIFAPLPQTPFANEKPGSISPALMDIMERFKTSRGIYYAKSQR
ncbi:MAG TPA: TIGR04013 family B12-binding domain/radical SAM domain-containing protein [Acidobacteriota bacterium]|nr:TIGR04013 family B12-binding domain/radical SAM domain-containing protein [Acidobacteriota bacterium]